MSRVRIGRSRVVHQTLPHLDPGLARTKCGYTFVRGNRRIVHVFDAVTCRICLRASGRLP